MRKVPFFFLIVHFFLLTVVCVDVQGQLIPRRSSESSSGEDGEKEPDSKRRPGQRIVDRVKQSNEKLSEKVSDLKEKTTGALRGKNEENEEKAENSFPPIPPESEAIETELSEELYDLSSSRAVGSTDMVEVLLEVAGDAKQITKERKQTTDAMKVVAGFRYEERILNFHSKEKVALKSVRLYDLARAKMSVGETKRTPELDKNHNLILCEIDNSGTTLFSPQGPLKSDQLLLIEGIPGNTLSLDLLLPEEKVKIGDSWKIPDHAIRSFVNIDAVETQSLEATLTSVAEDFAMVEIVGESQGAYLGAYTEMSVQARYQFDFRTRRINWVGMLIEEKRAVGHVGPGLEVKARLQVKISPLETPGSLSDEILEDRDLQRSEFNLRLRHDEGKGAWRFQHPRSWYLIEDSPKTTLLRMLEKGELVAQCNIVSMPRVERRSLTSLQRFADDLKQGLGKNFGQIAAMEESVNANGENELRVIIDGAVEDLPLRWVYYLLTDKKGNQVVVVFVIEAKKLQLFGESDQDILESFRILDMSL